MFVAAANESHILALLPQVAHIKIGWQIGTRQVAHMFGAVGIGQGSGDGMAFEILLWHGEK